jgi:hypothetical protein
MTKIVKHTKTPMQIKDITAERSMQVFYIDLIGKINPTSSSGNQYIFVAQCELSRFAIATPIEDATAISVAEAFIHEIILKFGVPLEIKTDNATAFNNEVLNEIAKKLKINKSNICPYNAKANIVERYNKTLKNYLTAFVKDKMDPEWDKLVPYGIYVYNNTPTTSHGFTPQELVFGFTSPISLDFYKKQPKYTYDSYLNELKTRLFYTNKIAKEKLMSLKEKNKLHYDKKVNELTVEENDLILLKNRTKQGKFDKPFTGPYRVKDVIGEAILKIQKGKKEKMVHKDDVVRAKAIYKNTPNEVECSKEIKL